MALRDRGCAKTPAFNLRVENPSRFSQSESQKCWRRLSEEPDRENRSALTRLAHVFPQPGPEAGISPAEIPPAHQSPGIPSGVAAQSGSAAAGEPRIGHACNPRPRSRRLGRRQSQPRELRRGGRNKYATSALPQLSHYDLRRSAESRRRVADWRKGSPLVDKGG